MENYRWQWDSDQTGHWTFHWEIIGPDGPEDHAALVRPDQTVEEYVDGLVDSLDAIGFGPFTDREVRAMVDDIRHHRSLAARVEALDDEWRHTHRAGPLDTGPVTPRAPQPPRGGARATRPLGRD